MLKVLLIFCLIPLWIFSEVDFCVLSWAKCGTHLLTNIISEITSKPQIGIVSFCDQEDMELIENAKKINAFIYTHKFSDWQFKELIEKKYKFLFIYRDPRDQIISVIHWLKYVGEKDRFYPIQIHDVETQIEELITGKIYGYSFYEFNVPFRQVLQLGNHVCIIKFEDLIGPNGGGNLEKQIDTILKIADFLHIPLTYEKAKEIGEKSWGKSETFRKGLIGQWKEFFTPRHIQLYKEKYGNILIELDYEKNLNW